jgi:hypothetical protein
MEETKFGFLEEDDDNEAGSGAFANDDYLSRLRMHDAAPLRRMRIAPATDKYPEFYTLPKFSMPDLTGATLRLNRVLACCDSMILEANPASGDCQFWSLAQSLNKYQGSSLMKLQQRLALFGLELGKLVASDLRRIAYCAFLVPHPDLDVHLERWKELAADPTLLGSYYHGRFLAKKRIDTLTTEDRLYLYDLLMSPSETWGDETSLIILERLLAVRVDVVCNGILQIRDPGHDEEPVVFVAMHLDRQHYESISCVNKSDQLITSGWAKDELPADLVAMHRQHCARSLKPWIRMSDDWLGAAVPDALVGTDNLVAHVTASCLPVLGKRAIAKLSDVGFSIGAGVPDVQDTLESGVAFATKTDMASVPERLVLADGGWMDASTPHNNCSMLQCGMALVGGNSFFRAYKTQRRTEPAAPECVKSVIPGAAFVHLF